MRRYFSQLPAHFLARLHQLLAQFSQLAEQCAELGGKCIAVAANQGKLSFNAPPKDIPPGRHVSFDDHWGNRVHILDMSASREEDR